MATESERTQGTFGSLASIDGLSDLAGFDLVYAVTQSAVNAQLGLLYALPDGGLPGTWKATTPKKTASIDATLGVPSIALAAGASTGSQVVMSIPLTVATYSGYEFSIGEDGKPIATPITTDVSGSALRLTSGLNLTGVAMDSASIPSEVRKQLNRFDSSMLDVHQLFLDLEDVNLLSSVQLDTGGKLDNEPTTLQAIDALVQALFDDLKGGGNPYVFGYVAINKQPDPATPTWTPTGMTYSLFADSAMAGRSTVNSLLVTDGRAVPGGGAGQFTSNWITSDNVEGVLVISQQLMMTQVLNSVASAIGQSPSIFHAEAGGRFVGSFNNQIGGTTTVTVAPHDETGVVTIDFHSSFRKGVYDKAGSDIGYVDGTIAQTSTLTFTVDGNTGAVSAGVVNGDAKTTNHQHPNALGEFEKVLSIFADVFLKLLTLGFAPNVFETLSDDDWSGRIVYGTVARAADIATRVVPPAGGELFFKDARFVEGGAMALDTTIRN